MKTSSLLAALLLVWASGTLAQSNQNHNGEFSGVVYSDYFWVAANHNNDFEGQNGFWIRRVYFTYDRELSDAFSARFRLEGSSPGDFTTEAKITPVIKDLYVRWSNDQHQVEVGITSTPTWGLVEDVWGYRSVEKSPLDLLDFSSSRDFGISAKGELDQEGRLNYHLMFANGSSNKSETNKGKKIMLSLGYELTEHLVVEGYADYSKNDNSNNWYTLQGFAGYQSDDFNLGLLYAHQARETSIVGSNPNIDLDIASIFTNFRLSETAKGFFRIDHTFNPVPGVQNNDYFPISNRAGSTILITGVDFDLSEEVHLMPNIEAASYQDPDDGGLKPDGDLIPRMTLSYSF